MTGRGDRGSAVVEFVLVAPIVLLLAAAALQVALLAHARATLTAAAAEGARAASLAEADLRVGEQRVRTIASGQLAAATVTDVTVRRAWQDGLRVVVARVAATVPLMGLLPPVDLVVEGRVLDEQPAAGVMP